MLMEDAAHGLVTVNVCSVESQSAARLDFHYRHIQNSFGFFYGEDDNCWLWQQQQKVKKGSKEVRKETTQETTPKPSVSAESAATATASVQSHVLSVERPAEDSIAKKYAHMLCFLSYYFTYFLLLTSEMLISQECYCFQQWQLFDNAVTLVNVLSWNFSDVDDQTSSKMAAGD